MLEEFFVSVIDCPVYSICHQGIETPRCIHHFGIVLSSWWWIHREVDLDWSPKKLLCKIHQGVKNPVWLLHWGVFTPWSFCHQKVFSCSKYTKKLILRCILHRGVRTPPCIHHSGVEIPRCIYHRRVEYSLLGSGFGYRRVVLPI
jgi:hypothetical protein